MKQKSLYLHIGTGKAGSTTIQHALGKQRETRFGYCQVEAFGLGNAWKLAAASGTDVARCYWIEDRKTLTPAEFDDLAAGPWDAARREVAESPCTRFVVSSEYIFAHYGEDRAAIGRLKDDLEGLFDEVRLVVYLRDQVSYLKSVYAQMVKGPLRATESFETFMDGIRSIRPLWDYRATLGAWADVFGSEALTVVMFDERNFWNSDLVSDFLHRIGIDEGAVSARDGGLRRSNQSPTYVQLHLLRRLNAAPAWVPDRPLRTLILNRRLRFEGIGFPGRFDRAVLARVSEGNAWVNETFLRGQKVRLPCLT